MKYIAVIAKEKRQFDSFLRPWVNPVDRKKFKLVRRVEDVYGCEFIECISIGDYSRIRDYSYIHEVVYSRIR